MTRPDDAVIFVTGGSRGIGAACARALADDGWAVALTYRTSPEGAAQTVGDIEDAGGRATAIELDVTDAGGIAGAVEAVGTTLGGPVLGLVNNAGVRADDLAVSIEDDAWDIVLDTNLTAAFRLTRQALRGMVRARFGRVVNVASVVGPRANAGQANYAAAKSGLIGFTRTAATEVARRSVTINAVAPGFIRTDMTADILQNGALDAIPARRAGEPDEVAACVRFLASDDAGYVTGTTLFVDGGLSA